MLTKHQRKLFAYQLTMPKEEDEDSFDSDLDLDQDIRGPEAVKKFVDSLQG